MKKPGSVKFLALFLAVLMAAGVFVLPAAAIPAAAATTTSSSSDYEELKNLLNAQSYAAYATQYSKQPVGSTTITLGIPANNVSGPNTFDLFDYELEELSDGGTAIVDFSQFGNPAAGIKFANDKVYRLSNVEGSYALLMPDSGKVSWKIQVPDRGMYMIAFEYYPINLEDSVATVERALSIDGAVPFAEARSLAFSKNWVYGYTEKVDGVETLKYEYRTTGSTIFEKAVSDFYCEKDKGGNDLRYIAYQRPSWRTYYCSDVNGFYHENFSFFFSAGEHTITLEGIRENLALRSIKLIPVAETKSYADYKNSFAGLPDNTTKDSVIRLEAEYPTAVSDTSVYPASDRSSAINSPSSPSSELMNTIGTKGYSTVGQWASYSFKVSESGWYSMTMRYKQNLLEGLYVSRVIKLSGKGYGLPDGTPTVPFKEAYNTRFNYSKSWCVEPLGDGNEEFKFYFEAGETYTLYLEVGLGTLSPIIETVENSLKVINQCYLDIIKLTGVSPDKYRDYKFFQVMPDTIRSLREQAKVLEKVSADFVELAGTKGSQVATLDQVALLLDKMGQKETAIAENLSNLKSYIGSLGTWLNNCKTQSLVFDYVNVQSLEAKAPKKNANFFQSAWFEISAFFVSFFVDYNSMGVKEGIENAESIDVWLVEGRDESLIWRNLIDTSYTPKSNVAVRLKLVVAGTLLPSVLSGKGPDVYVGLGSADVINYAIRGALEDVSKRENENGEMEEREGYIKTYGYDVTLTEHSKTDYTKKYYISEDTIAKSNACVAECLAAGISYQDHKSYIDPVTYYGPGEDPLHPPIPMKDSNGNIIYNADGVTPKYKYEVKAEYVIFNYANTIPISLLGKTYGVPETTNFSMMFYRMDVLADLEISAPKTWDDLLSAIPVLQSNNMEVGLTNGTAHTIFLYQMGGSQWLYEDDPEYAGAQVGLGTDVALDAFLQCCRLYTDYSFPVAFDAANRFRTGEMPIVITDYVSMYNTLTVFATEIRGLWTFTSMPGHVKKDAAGNTLKNADGTPIINNCSVTTQTSTVMLYKSPGKEKYDQAWDYMMWQAGEGPQADFGNRKVAIVGPAAKYATANARALKNLSWTSSEIKVLMEQFDNLAAIPNYPGSYIIARYVQFAFLASVNEGADPVEEMYSYITIINKELTRKREEFEMKTLEIGQVPPGYGAGAGQ